MVPTDALWQTVKINYVFKKEKYIFLLLGSNFFKINMFVFIVVHGIFYDADYFHNSQSFSLEIEK